MQTDMLIVSVIYIILSLYLIVKSVQIENSMKDLNKCMKNSTVRSSLKGITIIAVILLISTIAMILCSMKCDCTNTGITTTFYYAVLVIIAIILIVLGSIINSYASTEGCEGMDKHSKSIWVTGLLILIVLSSYYGIRVYANKNRKEKTNISKVISRI